MPEVCSPAGHAGPGKELLTLPESVFPESVVQQPYSGMRFRGNPMPLHFLPPISPFTTNVFQPDDKTANTGSNYTTGLP